MTKRERNFLHPNGRVAVWYIDCVLNNPGWIQTRRGEKNHIGGTRE